MQTPMVDVMLGTFDPPDPIKIGAHQIVCGVSYKEFCRLLPFDYQALDREGLLKQLGIQMTLKQSVLEEESMRVFEWWGGEYRPLEERIAEMYEVKKKQN